jgi:hypothetical protein
VLGGMAVDRKPYPLVRHLLTRLACLSFLARIRRQEREVQ